MSKTSFLTNEDIWETIPEIIKASNHTDVAVAYLGTDGAILLPLKKGDRLIVDMSPATVKSGATNPFEIEKLIKRGVKVFSRQDLHAKIILTNKALLVGSTNISKRSQNILDEAAIFTTDPIAMQRSKDFIERICIEPVLPRYLKECQKIYNSPRILKSEKARSKTDHERATHSKLWIISLRRGDIPYKEKKSFNKSEKKAERLIKNKETSILDNWNSPRPYQKVEVGDLMIQCIKDDDGNIEVLSPSRLILIDEYIRNQETGAKRYIYHMESPISSQAMEWKEFRKAYKAITQNTLQKPKTIGIKDTKQADDFKHLWTTKGRISKKK